MQTFRRRTWLLLGITLVACSQQTKETTVTSADGEQPICPIPLVGYDRIPGYQPGRVNPSLSQKSITFISPTLEGNPRFYLGILQQPVQFCGTAKPEITTVRVFASGAYTYEQKSPIPAQPQQLLGEVLVKDGVWFFNYDFRAGNVIDVLAKGYDANDQLVATTSLISISLAGPDPR